MSKDNFKIDLGLDKLDKELNDVFKPTKKQVKGGHYEKKVKQSMKKNKPIMTKEEKEKLAKETKKVIKSTGSAFGSLIKKIKNRKINKLEKDYFKSKEKSEALAHEIKLRMGIDDHETDIERYEKELEKLKSPKQRHEETQSHSLECKEYNLGLYPDTDKIVKCICGVDKE
jgi:hypothetical protein